MPIHRHFAVAALALSLAMPLTSVAFDGPIPAALATSSAYHEITPEEGKAMIGKEGVLLLDVRHKAEYRRGHIEGAVNMPQENIPLGRTLTIAPDTSVTMLLYCRSGSRARKAAEKLIASGYTKVYNMGGVQDWTYGLVK